MNIGDLLVRSYHSENVSDYSESQPDSKRNLNHNIKTKEPNTFSNYFMQNMTKGITPQPVIKINDFSDD